MNALYDVIVVGSGFGGSVSALRLAEKGYRVLVLEKGRRYRPEDFPRTNWDLRKSVWMPRLGLHGIWGLTLLRHVFVLHGVGVGGGSLNYCNNLLVPPDAVLNRPGWGPGRWKERLATHSGLRREMRTFSAPRVVLSGGVMGTVKLLLRCRRSGLLPRLSDRLGDFVRTNSEALVGAVARDRNADFSDHLSINSGIYPDEATHVEVVRFARGSDLMGLITTLLADGGGCMPRPARYLGTVIRHPLDFLRSLNPMGWGARTPILPVMQTTDSHLRLDYRPRWHRLGGCSMNTRLAPGAAPIPSYIPVANEIARRLAERIDGRPVSSWPEVLLDVPTTAHILGGAVMGETPEQGVVGFDGQVHGYRGLYVVDGSNVPVNLGVNPSLTITAMAETVMGQVPKKGA